MSTATEMLALYIAAEAAVLKGQSYRWGERQFTRADLTTIIAGREKWQRIVSNEQAAAAGQRGLRYSLADFSGDA
jgi:hypothetical protein